MKKRKIVLLFGLIFFSVISVLCVINWGLVAFGLVVAFVLFLSVLGSGVSGRRRSMWTGNYYTESGTTPTDFFGIFVTIFLLLTAPLLAIQYGNGLFEIAAITILLLSVGVAFVVYVIVKIPD